MSASVISMRAHRAMLLLQRDGGWPLEQARWFADALEALPGNVQRFAFARRVLRPEGISVEQTRDCLIALGYLEVERCGCCARALPPKSCRFVQGGQPYCSPGCQLDAAGSR